MTKSCFFFKQKPKPVKEKQQQVQNPVFSEPEPDWPSSEPIDIPKPNPKMR
jgi:hypothetical protein